MTDVTPSETVSLQTAVRAISPAVTDHVTVAEAEFEIVNTLFPDTNAHECVIGPAPPEAVTITVFVIKAWLFGGANPSAAESPFLTADREAPAAPELIRNAERAVTKHPPR